MKEHKPVLIYGNGYLAEMARYLFEHDGGMEINGFCLENNLKLAKERFDGLILLNFDHIEETRPPDQFDMFIAVGNNYRREEIFQKVKRKGYRLISFVESSVLRYENLNIGENVFITGTSGIQPFVKIGNNSFVISSKIGHHSTIGKHCLISGCHLAGGINVGNRTFIGINSIIKQKVKIGNDNIIGMGSTITEDTGDGEVYSTPRTTRKMDFPSDRIKSQYM